jgi:hypothetical protein
MKAIENKGPEGICIKDLTVPTIKMSSKELGRKILAYFKNSGLTIEPISKILDQEESSII